MVDENHSDLGLPATFRTPERNNPETGLRGQFSQHDPLLYVAEQGYTGILLTFTFWQRIWQSIFQPFELGKQDTYPGAGYEGGKMISMTGTWFLVLRFWIIRFSSRYRRCLRLWVKGTVSTDRVPCVHIIVFFTFGIYIYDVLEVAKSL